MPKEKLPAANTFLAFFVIRAESFIPWSVRIQVEEWIVWDDLLSQELVVSDDIR